jgi:hypothetical protein
MWDTLMTREPQDAGRFLPRALLQVAGQGRRVHRCRGGVLKQITTWAGFSPARLISRSFWNGSGEGLTCVARGAAARKADKPND